MRNPVPFDTGLQHPLIKEIRLIYQANRSMTRLISELTMGNISLYNKVDLKTYRMEGLPKGIRISQTLLWVASSIQAGFLLGENNDSSFLKHWK